MKSLPRAAALSLLLALGPGGCIRPLYGTAEFGGLGVDQGLKGVKIEVQGERLAHYLRNELEFDLRGGAPDPGPPKYRLAITLRQTTAAALIDRVLGTAESAALEIEAKYALYPIVPAPAGAAPPPPPRAITEGEARVQVSYDRGQQRFAAIRSARDAEIRGGKQLAEQLRTRVAAFLATQR